MAYAILVSSFPYGLVARISRSHRGGPGSIPGGGVPFELFIISKGFDDLKSACHYIFKN